MIDTNSPTTNFETAVNNPSLVINQSDDLKTTRTLGESPGAMSEGRLHPRATAVLEQFYHVSQSPLMSMFYIHGKSYPAATQWLIFLSGILAGVMTDDGLSKDVRSDLEFIEQVILWCFTLECFLEFMGSGEYSGPGLGERRYQPNLMAYFQNKWNMFDLTVVVLCHIFGKSFQSVRLLRLLRIIETSKAMRVLVAGVLDGGKFIFSICLLLSLVFYVFAVIGTYAFQQNDQEHFASLDLSMLSLFRCATLEDWTDIMYINMYGCDKYGYDEHPSACTDPQAYLYFSPIYFSLLVFVGNMIYMNLFVAVVTTAMTSATDVSTGKPSEEVPGKLAQEDIEFMQWVLQCVVFKQPSTQGWLHYSLQMKSFTMSSVFKTFLACSIVGAGISSGIQVHEISDRALDLMGGVDIVVISCFALEFLCKVSAEGQRPWKYWTGRNWRWNNFDFIVLVTCLVPSSRAFGGVMRLLSLAKLVTTVPTLNIIVDGLVIGFNNMLYTLLLLLLVFYIFAIQGILMFRENDPWHFSSFAVAYITLLRCCTGDDWTDIMYINIYGCNRYPYSDNYGPGMMYKYVTGVECDAPNGQGISAAAFFVIFMVIVSLVMVNLFVGVVTSGINQVMERVKKHEEDSDKLEVVVKMFKIEDRMLEAYVQLFNMADSSHENDGSLSQREVLTIFKTTFSQAAVTELIQAVDIDGSGFLDISEFCILAHITQIMKSYDKIEDAYKACEGTISTLKKQNSFSSLGNKLKRALSFSKNKPEKSEKQAATAATTARFNLVLSKVLGVLSGVPRADEVSGEQSSKQDLMLAEISALSSSKIPTVVLADYVTSLEKTCSYTSPQDDGLALPGALS